MLRVSDLSKQEMAELLEMFWPLEREPEVEEIDPELLDEYEEQHEQT